MFDHEKLKAYRHSLRFVHWVGPLLESVTKRYAAKEQLDRASTSVPLNIAEGNGKRSHRDRCRYLDIARGSAVECAACLDVLAARGAIAGRQASEGKEILVAVVSLVSGLIAYFSPDEGTNVREDQASYGNAVPEEFLENE
ncbi:MAG: four helix bundle protein [Synoicihabitans sp.]